MGGGGGGGGFLAREGGGGGGIFFPVEAKASELLVRGGVLPYLAGDSALSSK